MYIENLPYALETLIGNILGCIQVPPSGGPQVRFSIGASDKQALQPPLSASLPVTGTCVSFLFRQLGMCLHFCLSNVWKMLKCGIIEIRNKKCVAPVLCCYDRT